MMSKEQAQQENSGRIIRNVLVNWVAFLTTLLTGFFMSPFLVRHLGDSVYGVWILTGSLISYLVLLDFGITPTIVKHIAEHRARDDQEAINRVVTGGLAVFSVLGIIAFSISLTFAFFFNDIFHTPLSDKTAALVVILAGLNLSLTFPASVFIGVVRGYQRYDLDAGITSLLILVRSVLIVALIVRGNGILVLSVLTIAFDVARLLYLMRWAYRLNPALRIAREYLKWDEIRRLSGYSSYIFLINVGAQINFFMDSIVIGLYLSTAAVTVYFIANRLISYLRTLVMEMVGVLLPTISDLNARDDQAGVQDLLVIGTKYTLLITLPMSAIFWLMGDQFIQLWMGRSYQQSFVLLQILTVGILAHMAELTTTTVLIGTGKHSAVARFTLLQALTNVVLSLILVKPYGLVGMALATAISMVVFTFIAFPIYFRFHLHLPFGSFLRRSMLLPFVIQIPFIALLMIFKSYDFPVTFLAFFGQVSIAMALYGALAFFTCLGQNERGVFLRPLDKFKLKLAARGS